MKATLIKRQTDDGIFTMLDSIPLGKIYDVDMSSIDIKRGYNIEQSCIWEHEMVRDINTGHWLPTELLAFGEIY